MQDYEKGFIALAIMGALIALGKMLNSDEPITARLVLGRVIVGSALSVAAGVALYFVTDIHPLALAGIGSALGILGLNGVEAWLRKKGIGFLGKGADK
ncbi:TPA: holin [Salmonella enterica]|nr:holin [Salmonella enterica]